ncbi:hypothetical protein VNI00_008685 [Paramarasmius palmivorus]|uniref:Fungal-type protein kinase domain-containing protein n=1 Tax=Paramarasmius palmivorus TaxID=297713 RepID=A0AAW0CT74_9AGAR
MYRLVQIEKFEPCFTSLVEEMEEVRAAVPQIEWELFKKACLPQVNQEHLDALYSQLKVDGTLEDDTWRGFRSDSTQDEENHYEPLVGCFNEVVAKSVALQNGGKPRIVLKRPEHALLSENPDASYKPDIVVGVAKTRYVGGLDEGSTGYECDVVLLGEFERSIKDRTVDENVVKITENSAQVMFNDPTRRFIFGITIECTTIRLWFFSRSHILVTHDLDLEVNVKDIVYFIAALASAIDEELGFDSSVRRVWYGDGIHYQYRVGGKTYQTVRMVSGSKARLVLGRGTRVWEVVEVLSGSGEPIQLGCRLFILKDSWIPEDAPTEKEVLDSIYERVNQYHDLGLDRSRFYDYFVKIEACERICINSTMDSEQLGLDSSTNFLREETIPDDPHAFLLRRKKVGSGSLQWEAPVGALPGQFMPQGTSRIEIQMSRKRVHCRTLSERFGMVLHEITNHKMVLEAITYMITGMKFMYSAGYVHRDISSGNLLVSISQGNVVCKLIDLECAKRMDEPTFYKDSKTGSPYFIAVEVEQGLYSFLPDDDNPSPDEVECFESTEFPATDASATFRHNWLHDIESLFWIVVYRLFSTYPDGKLVTSLRSNHETFHKLFLSGQTRASFLANDQFRKTTLSQLPPEFHQEGQRIHNIGKALKAQYRKIEALPSFPRVKMDFGDVFDLFEQYFSKVLGVAFDGSVLVPIYSSG